MCVFCFFPDSVETFRSIDYRLQNFYGRINLIESISILQLIMWPCSVGLLWPALPCTINASVTNSHNSLHCMTTDCEHMVVKSSLRSPPSSSKHTWSPSERFIWILLIHFLHGWEDMVCKFERLSRVCDESERHRALVRSIVTNIIIIIIIVIVVIMMIIIIVITIIINISWSPTKSSKEQPSLTL